MVVVCSVQNMFCAEQKKRGAEKWRRQADKGNMRLDLCEVEQRK